jgi:hypothetical protein
MDGCACDEGNAGRKKWDQVYSKLGDARMKCDMLLKVFKIIIPIPPLTS